MSIIPAMFLDGGYLNLKTGAECLYAGCVVSVIDHICNLSEEGWKSFDEFMKVGWTPESRAGAACVRGGGAKPGVKGSGAAAEHGAAQAKAFGAESGSFANEWKVSIQGGVSTKIKQTKDGSTV